MNATRYYSRGRRGSYFSFGCEPGSLRAERRELGLTQAEAAAAYGVTERTYRAWELAGRMCRPVDALVLARANPELR